MRPLFFTLFFALAAGAACGQSFSKSNVLRLDIRSTGPIYQDGQVNGYYYFYDVERKDYKNNHFMLTIYDENLREVNSTDIVRPRSYVLVDAAFNGEAFAFLFFDGRVKRTELLTYDRELKQLGSVIRGIKNRQTVATYMMLANGGSASQAFLVPVKDKGFINYGFRDDKKNLYEVICYDNELKKIWSSVADGLTKVELASEAFQSPDYIGTVITKKKTVSSKDIQFELMVQDVATGNIKFRVPLETKYYSLSFSNIFMDEETQNIVIFGEYNYRGQSDFKDPGLGFMTLVLDLEGKVVLEKLNSWEMHISKAAPVNERGKFDGNNSRILFHEFIRTKDGKVFAIGEQYKKVASAGGTVGNVMMIALTGSAPFSFAQLNVYNMVIFEFAPDYTIQKVHVFEKDKNVVSLPSGAEFLTPRLVSYYARAIGGFDFAFAHTAPDKETFYVSYVNYDREKGEKGKNTLGTIVYTPEKQFVVDKLQLDRSSSVFLVNRAKHGYVMVIEYFRKEKRLDSRLEKVNY